MVTRPKKQYTYPQSDKGFFASDYQSRAEYHTARWRRMRKVFLEQPDHKLCVRCKAKGRYTLARTVDHIIPAEICGDFWNTNNWQPLCNRCNMEKWAEDRAAIQEYKRTHNGREK